MYKKNSVIVIVLFIILCFFPMHGAFADNTTTTTTASTSVEIINLIIKFLSRGRTIPAILAGKLMSNDFIYASGIGLDKSLFTMWNYMKNFANFTLGFLLVFKIAKSLFTKDAFSIKKELPNFLLASILVNMSWFLMGTIIDVANVATAAVGSFPQSMISDNVMQSIDYDKLNVSIPEKICANLDEGQQTCSQTFSPTQRIDRVRARFNDMSGPLLYIGASIYRFQEYSFLNQGVKNFKDFTTGTIIKILMLLMYITPIIALFIINLKRVFYLWLRIVFSPIIVLGEILKIGAIKKLGDSFSMKEILGMVFQPVFVIGGMAIVLILGVSMFSVMGGHPGSSNQNEQVSKVFGGAEIISAPNSSTFHNTTAGTEITYAGDVFKDVAGYAGGLVGYLIITTFVIMLLWAVVKMSTSSSKIAGGTFDKITSLSKDLVTGMNIIPMGGSRVSLASMMNAGDGITRGISNKLNINKANASSKLETALGNTAFGKMGRKLYGDGFMQGENISNDLSKSEAAGILNAGKEKNFAAFMNNIATQLHTSKEKNKNKHITLHSSEFKDSIYQSIMSNTEVRNSVAEGLGLGNDGSKLTKEALFDGKSASSKKFLEYLQKKLSGDKVPENLKDFQVSNIYIGSEFPIFGGDEKNHDTPAEKK